MYEKHFAPHDIAARDLSSGVSREQTMANLGYRMNKGARLGVEDRIEASRQFLKNCWFDAEKCKHGIRALQNYRREYNDRLDQFIRMNEQMQMRTARTGTWTTNTTTSPEQIIDPTQAPF